MIEPFGDLQPRVHPSAFVHEQALLIGDVFVEEGASVWPFAVLRGDMGPIVIGRDSNIQDGAICHDTGAWEGREGLLSGSAGSRTLVGERVTVGHRAVLHGCRIGNDVLVGMGAILLDHVEIGDDCLIGAGALVPQGTIVPAGSLVLGSPARIVREILPKERAMIRHASQAYLALVRRRLLP